MWCYNIWYTKGYVVIIDDIRMDVLLEYMMCGGIIYNVWCYNILYKKGCVVIIYAVLL